MKAHLSLIFAAVLWLVFLLQRPDPPPPTPTRSEPGPPQSVITAEELEAKAEAVQDAIALYRRIERTSDDAARCEQAGVVADAFLQAEAFDGYELWTKTAEEACEAASRKAGMSR